MMHMGDLVRDTIGTEEQKILLERYTEYFVGATGRRDTVVRGFIRRALAEGMKHSGLKSLKEAALSSPEERVKYIEDALQRLTRLLKLRYDEHHDACLNIYYVWKKEYRND